MVALYYQLLEHSKAQQVLQLKIKEVEELDITFIQVLLALVRFHEIHQNPIDIQLDLSPDLIKQIHIAGLSKILNYNPS